MPASAWTRRLPRKPGFYWRLPSAYAVEAEKYADVVLVRKYDDHIGLIVEDVGMEGYSAISDYKTHHWWSGPLPCPPFPAPPKKG